MSGGVRCTFFRGLRCVLAKLISVLDYLILHRFVYPVRTVILSVEREWEAFKRLIYNLVEEVEETVDGLQCMEEAIRILQASSVER